jgi:NodT family efflux transporter outer membrane factor (OMF) lipoprotein
MNSQKLKINFIFMIFIISSCTIGPDYNKISLELPENYKETANEKWKKAEPKDEKDKGKWWEIFQDPLLNKFEEQLEISNQTIAVAMAQYEQAQALVGESTAGNFPTINGSGGTTRQRSSATSVSPATESTNFNSSLSATWIPDLWGSVRRTVEASKAGEQASAAQLANVKLTAQASLAQYYFQLRAADINQKLLDDTVENYKKALEITERLRSAGTATLTDYTQAETQLVQAQALAQDNKITRAQYEHAIAILLGKTPSQFSLEVTQIKFNPPEIPLLLPSELLERRPDVAQAERLVAQANAQIGVAVSAYFPNLSLSSTGGYSSNIFSNLFTLPTLFWSLGANLSETIFDGGLREAKIETSKANYKATVAQYKQTVFVALQNVEDNLVAIRILKNEEEFQKNAAANAQTVENLITHGYEVGTNTYTDVIHAQTTSYTAQKTVNDITVRRMTNAVNLITALGGGWKKEDKTK